MWELDRAFGAIAAAGFDAIELMVTRDPRTQSSEAPLRLAKKEGLSIVALHAPMLVMTRRVWGPNFMKIIERSTSVAKGMGCDVIVVHPPYLWEVRYQTWLLTQLAKYSAEHGVAIAVENMFRLWVRGRPVRGHRWVSPTDLKGFNQVTLDTSHCGVDGFDIMQALEEIGGGLSHIHLSDSHGDHKDNHAFPGTGKLPLKEFLRNIPASAYQGAVSLELDMREFVRIEGDLDDALRRALHFCEDNLA